MPFIPEIAKRDEKMVKYVAALHNNKFDGFWSDTLLDNYDRTDAPTARRHATLQDDVESIVWTDLWFMAFLNERLDLHPGEDYATIIQRRRTDNNWLRSRLREMNPKSGLTMVRHSRLIKLCDKQQGWRMNDASWLRAASHHYRWALDEILQEEAEDEVLSALEAARELWSELPFDGCSADLLVEWSELPYIELSSRQIEIHVLTRY